MTTEIGDSVLLDTWAASGDKVDPGVSKIGQGWTLGEKPPYEYMNWIQNTFGAKINHLLTYAGAVWVNSTVYPVGAVTTYDGSMWMSVASNSNSEPSGTSSDWAMIPTIDDVPSLPTITTYSEGLLAEGDAALWRTGLGLGTFAVANTSSYVQSQAVWNAGTSTTESTITPAKLQAKIEDATLGFGGDLSDLSGSRAFETTYRNTTGRPFMLAIDVSGNNAGNFVTIQLSTNGVVFHEVAGFSDVDSGTVRINSIVPAGLYYRASGTTMNRWMEIA